MSFSGNRGKPWVDPGPDQCEMVDAGRGPVDLQCLEPSVGTVAESGGVRVCGACAVQMEREDFAVDYGQQARFVIAHPEMGVYLGSAMGLGFWSRADPVGQPSAITFEDRATAERVMAGWDRGRPDAAVVHPVVPDDQFAGLWYASPAACAAAGLEAWDPETKPGESPA